MKKNGFKRMTRIVFSCLALILVLAGCEESSSEDNKKGGKLEDLTGTVTIGGTIEVDETLTANTGSLPGSGAFTFQWQSGSSALAFSNIDGANLGTYQIKSEDIGKYIRVRVKRAGYSDKWLDSASVGPVPAPLPIFTGTVAINGNAEVGSKLTANVTGHDSGVTLIYQWQNGTGSNFADIQGANASDYIVQITDVGLQIRVAVKSEGFRNNYSEPSAVVTVLTVARQLETLFEMAILPDTYDIIVFADETIDGCFLDFDGDGIEITVKGASSTNNTLTLREEGAMFTVHEGVTLTLEDVVLIGINDNTYPLIDIWEGTLIMNNGAVIKNNTNLNDLKYYSGGGVYNFIGTFTMNGGTITGNTSNYGGGVFIDAGYFIMNGGEITNNTAEVEGGGVYNEWGYSYEGYFEMNGGTISGNKAGYGGGVSNNGAFSMVDGTISGNTSEEGGGGVFNDGYANFIMNDGTISGNKSKYGGGVSNWYDFYMEDGTISGNTSEQEGGGVHNEGYFFMFDGTISGNKSKYGGGVTNWSVFGMLDGEISANEATATDGGGGGVDNFDYYDEGCIFYMQGGIIHGSNAAANLRNKSTGGFDSLSNYNTEAYHGIFFVEEQGDVDVKGSLPNANLTIEVKDGVLLREITAKTMTITGIDDKYHGKKAVLAYKEHEVQGAIKWGDLSDEVEVSDSTLFTYSWPVVPQQADIRLYIFDVVYFSRDILIKYGGNINIVVGNTTVAIDAFTEVKEGFLTITDLPANIDEYWELVLFNRNVDGYGNSNDNYYWMDYVGYVGSYYSPINAITVDIPDGIETGVYNLSMQFRHYTTRDVVEEYFFTITILPGDNEVSFSTMAKQTLTPRVTPPSMKRAPRTERTMSSARQTTTAAPAREMKQKQKASANLHRPFPNLITIQDMMKGVRHNHNTAKFSTQGRINNQRPLRQPQSLR